MGQKREREPEPDSDPKSESAVSQSQTESIIGDERHEISSDLRIEKKQVNRCNGCRQKVGLIGFRCRCRCRDVFCWEHRYSDRHDCQFDYKASGRAAIEKDNSVVRPAKILKV